MQRRRPCLCARRCVFFASAAGKHPTRNEAAPQLAPARSPARSPLQTQLLHGSASLSPGLPSLPSTPQFAGGSCSAPKFNAPTGCHVTRKTPAPRHSPEIPGGPCPPPSSSSTARIDCPHAATRASSQPPHHPHLGPLGASAPAAALACNTRPAVLNVNCLPSCKPGQRPQSSALTPTRMFPGPDLESPATHPKQRGQSLLQPCSRLQNNCSVMTRVSKPVR